MPGMPPPLRIICVICCMSCGLESIWRNCGDCSGESGGGQQALDGRIETRHGAHLHHLPDHRTHLLQLRARLDLRKEKPSSVEGGATGHEGRRTIWSMTAGSDRSWFICACTSGLFIMLWM